MENEHQRLKSENEKILQTNMFKEMRKFWSLESKMMKNNENKNKKLKKSRKIEENEKV